jgi:hypothetical protein
MSGFLRFQGQHRVARFLLIARFREKEKSFFEEISNFSYAVDIVL